MSEIVQITREQFVASLTNEKADRFARTFVAKADTQLLWGSCWGFLEEGKVAAAIIWTHSKRSPHVTNLQLLHTFFAYRGRGYAKKLVNFCLEDSKAKAQYFRVSSENDAVDFYKKCGLEFAGKQKSGCQLCIFRWDNKPVYDYNDPTIRAAVFRKGKGGCVETFFKDEQTTLMDF